MKKEETDRFRKDRITMLKYMKEIRTTDFNTYRALFDIFKDCVVEDKEWCAGTYKDLKYSSIDLDCWSVWSTFINCTELIVRYHNEKQMKITVTKSSEKWGYDCAGEYTEREDIWQAKMIAPIAFIDNLNNINDCFTKCCQEEYEEMLKKKEKEWINKRKKKILGGL